MAIWPWRSRPTVQPWNDDYNVTTRALPTGLTPIASDLIIPDNIFAQIIYITANLTNVAGARVNQFVNWQLYRSNALVLHSAYHLNTSTGQLSISYATTYSGLFMALDPMHATQYLPHNFLLLPNDIFSFAVTGGLAGDTLDACLVTLKEWEIY